MGRTAILPQRVIVRTLVVPGPDRVATAHYEIHVAPHGVAPPTVLITRRVELYAIAAAAEGSSARFDVEWHVEQSADGRRRHVLDALGTGHG
jgi:hypothetical protein